MKSGVNTGNSIMAFGDIVQHTASSTYRCNDNATNCATIKSMLFTYGLYGSIGCADDAASCILDGQLARRIIYLQGTGGQILTIRALVFKDGQPNSGYGGGTHMNNGALVDIELCIFTNCRSTISELGGGAIYVSNSSNNVVNVFGTSFYGNEALNGGDGDDIYRNGGTITIHDTCPSPYAAKQSAQGKTRTTTKRVASSSLEPFITHN